MEAHLSEKQLSREGVKARVTPSLQHLELGTHQNAEIEEFSKAVSWPIYYYWIWKSSYRKIKRESLHTCRVHSPKIWSEWSLFF